MTFTPLWTILTSSTYALPLDVFRILVGLLSLAYFWRTYQEAPQFSSPTGLLDHALVRRLLPFTRLSLFPSGARLTFFQGMYGLGCVASVCLSLGLGVKPAALVLYLLAVSTYRWNFLVMYVDDVVMHLVLFWLLLLPIGHTLTLPELILNPAESWAAWQHLTVSGLAGRCFVYNLALVYVVAGLWKWTSPLWRNGSALAVVLKLSVCYAPNFWRPHHRFWLMLGNYYALLLEPLLALLIVLPAHAALKWVLFAGAISFHVGIIASMKIPFANLAMLGGGVVLFRVELMQWLGAPALRPQALPLTFSDGVALTVVACLTLLFLLDACWFRAGYSPPLWKSPVARRPRLNPLYVPLWLMGLAQSYRLFDWIDDRNYHVAYEVLEARPGSLPRRLPATTLFPHSIRHILLQTYLYGNIWVKVDPALLPEVRATILAGYARRFCQRYRAAATVEVYATIQRLTADNLDLQRGTRTLLLRFANHNGQALVTYMRLEC